MIHHIREIDQVVVIYIERMQHTRVMEKKREEVRTEKDDYFGVNFNIVTRTRRRLMHGKGSKKRDKKITDLVILFSRTSRHHTSDLRLFRLSHLFSLMILPCTT